MANHHDHHDSGSDLKDGMIGLFISTAFALAVIMAAHFMAL